MTLLLLKDDDEALFEDDEAIFAEEEDLLLLDPFDTADCGASPELVEGLRVTLLLLQDDDEEEEGSSSLRVAHDSASRS